MLTKIIITIITGILIGTISNLLSTLIIEKIHCRNQKKFKKTKWPVVFNEIGHFVNTDEKLNTRALQFIW